MLKNFVLSALTCAICFSLAAPRADAHRVPRRMPDPGGDAQRTSFQRLRGTPVEPGRIRPEIRGGRAHALVVRENATIASPESRATRATLETAWGQVQRGEGIVRRQILNEGPGSDASERRYTVQLPNGPLVSVRTRTEDGGDHVFVGARQERQTGYEPRRLEGFAARVDAGVLKRIPTAEGTGYSQRFRMPGPQNTETDLRIVARLAQMQGNVAVLRDVRIDDGGRMLPPSVQQPALAYFLRTLNQDALGGRATEAHVMERSTTAIQVPSGTDSGLNVTRTYNQSGGQYRVMVVDLGGSSAPAAE